jgi:MFS family permease
MGLLMASFSDNERGKAFSAYAPVLSLAAIAGPLMAGGLIRWDLFGTGWRLVFFVNLVLGGVAIAAGRRYLPRDGDASAERLDPRGVVIVAAATLGLVYPLIEGQSLGWPWWIFVLLSGGIAGCGLFARHERRTSAPLIAPGRYSPSASGLAGSSRRCSRRSSPGSR